QSQQLEAETVFAGLRIAFAVTALDEAAQDSKHRRLGQPYCGHDLPEAQRRLRVAEYGEDVEGSTEHPDGIAIVFLHDCFLASLSHGWRPRAGVRWEIWYSIPLGGTTISRLFAPRLAQAV